MMGAIYYACKASVDQCKCPHRRPDGTWDYQAQQRDYAARRAAHTRLAGPPTVEIRIVFRHALDKIERHPSLEAAAKAHPDAKRIEIVSENGGFW